MDDLMADMVVLVVVEYVDNCMTFRQKPRRGKIVLPDLSRRVCR